MPTMNSRSVSSEELYLRGKSLSALVALLDSACDEWAAVRDEGTYFNGSMEIRMMAERWKREAVVIASMSRRLMRDAVTHEQTTLGFGG